MNLYSVILDNFFEPEVIESLRAHCKETGFRTRSSPYDGVDYPDIGENIPDELQIQVYTRLSEALGGTIIDPKALFCRLSKKGIKAPHQAHTDKVMGDLTLLVYLTEDKYCQGGTSILEHNYGMSRTPRTEGETKLWELDMNRYNMWKQVSFCPMKYNRAFIIDSDLFHRAEPVEGFGNNIDDGRLVLTCFFDILK